MKSDDELEKKDNHEEEEVDDATDDDFNDAQFVKLSAPSQTEDNSLCQSHARFKCLHWEKHKSNDFFTFERRN